MMEAVDKGDSANFNLEEVLKPEGWVLLNFLMDARTGLGRFRKFQDFKLQFNDGSYRLL